MHENEKTEVSGKARGGKALAAKRTPEERKAASAKATAARKELSSLPEISYGSVDTPLVINGVSLECYVLDDEDKTRVITTSAIGIGLGFHPDKASARLVNLMGGDRIKPYINSELSERLDSPIRFKYPSNSIIGYAYPATILADICDAILAARKENRLQVQQQHIAAQAEILIRGFARVGIIALIDEVTGYQRDRKRDALAAILEKFVSKEMRPWLKTFQLDFFEELCRVWGYSMPEKPGAYPPVFAHVIRDIVYDRLAPGVRSQLQDLKKKRGGKMHQWLTGNAGYNDLTRHLGELTMLLRVTPDGAKDQFMSTLDRFKPKLTIEELIDASDASKQS